MRFALMETKVALASILSRFDLKVVPKTPKQLAYTKDMSIKVEGCFWLGFAPRTKV
jgi:cytochrome P450